MIINPTLLCGLKEMMGLGPGRLQELTEGNYGDDYHGGACPFLLKVTKFHSTCQGPTGWFSVLPMITEIASHGPASVGSTNPMAPESVWTDGLQTWLKQGLLDIPAG